ncbi:hypothetical protein N657DRAFT_660802 [Parathielavia appendiculata]|uniref:Multiple RNA-binding domain-containing protein 1 n=1 Tax=Parathielavia appendiculata TaxID=2587402 RepID=A0AAN6UAI6_9PEZI|nr:hypothetical protein N657DRAFT_660802 [Parathielavia appendiculata]
MESSRIFVKNLPPNISETDFRKHFSAQGREVTDVKLIPNRRIGFVGYKSPDDAVRAVKYFNKSFIRMSRIAVDLAKPIADSTPRPAARDSPRPGTASSGALLKSGASRIEQLEDESSKKRKREVLDEADARLQEYLEVMGRPNKKSRDDEALSGSLQSDLTSAVPAAVFEAGESDDEYEDIPARHAKRPAQENPTRVDATAAFASEAQAPAPVTVPGDEPPGGVPQVSADATDDDWLRSRTSRLLDLVDPDDPEFSVQGPPSAPVVAPTSESQDRSHVGGAVASVEEPSESTAVRSEGSQDAAKLVEQTSRLFLRNLSYSVTEDDIREHFSKFGTLEEVNVPLDNRGQSKGFAMVRYEQPAAALAAFQTDGSIFQGRIIHILPASAKRDNKLDEFAISKLPLKKQQLLKKKAEAASSTFNWNSLFMSQDAVNTAVAERLGVSKHELLDPTDASAAVKQAVAETTVIQEAKGYFAAHGVNIEAFKSQQRGDTSILVKNIRNASIEELRGLFEEHGTVLRVLMPPSGTIAIVQFAQPAACRAAFAKKAYSRFKESILFLEKGPKGLFLDHAAAPLEDRPAGVQKPSVAALLEGDDDEDQTETTSLFVRNLNFSTTTEGLTNAFKPLDGFVSATVKTKTDPKRPGQVLSMGFGFCAFKTKKQAQAALKVMDGYVLDGYKLLVKASHRGHDAAEERRREDLAKKAAAQRTKIVIKNLPFEASKKDVRALFSAYGKLVALRLPKKFNHMSRGFAFAEFATAKEALNALTALKDTHLLGRRLVLDYAEADEIDPEEQIRAMEKKIRGQVNKLHIPFPMRLIVPAPAVPRHPAPTEKERRFPWRPPPRAGCPCVPVAMELPMSLPVLSTQCYSPSADHGFEGRRGLSTSRQPLQESTGNIQHPHMSWYAQQLEAHSSVPSSIPPLGPLILRTQSTVSEYCATAPSRSQHRHGAYLHGRRRSHGTNPLMPFLSQAFKNYRKKQSDKHDQKWPDVLETPFLDALLLIPRMGRKKYTMKQRPYGRNMLIGDYLWIAYCQGLPPGAEPDPRMMRQRKMVSSHIQVLKDFFTHHRCFHFFFWPTKEDKENDPTETVSLKDNPVLIALSGDRFPEERPNYEYFAQILSLNEQVQFKPKRCWIFVSHQDVVVGEDRIGCLPTTGGKLTEGEYPHLGLNLERDTWAKEEQQFFKGALLHEFTKKLVQIESSSVREMARKWESAFPDLHQRLKAITSTTTDARCDFLHLHVTLELKEKRRFPSGSNLSSWVEINIEKPGLVNHRWKVDTRLVRPLELSYSQGDGPPEVVYEEHKEFALEYQHKPGCDASRSDSRGHCDCLSQRCRRDGVMVPFPVPFPANVWAQTLTNCAEYPAHPSSESIRHDRERGSAVKTEDGDNEGQRSRRRTKWPTQMDLVPKIAMMQEIWSFPPTSSAEEGSSDWGNRRWTRRAVILWTFETIHKIVFKQRKPRLVTAQGGSTNWRFLTILDPASEYHQRQAIISGRRVSADEYRDAFGCVSRPASRNAGWSSRSTHQQPLSASLSEEGLSSAWGHTGGLGSLSVSTAQAAYDAHFMQQAISTHATTTGNGLLDSFNSHAGLATPTPSASLASSFDQTFDSASTSPDILATYMTTHAAVTTAGLDTSSHSFDGSLSAVTDPFLAHVGTAYGAAQDGIHGWDDHGVAGGIDPTASWSSGYSVASGAHGHNGLVNWTGSQLHTARHQTLARQERQPWKPPTAGIDEQEPWTPASPANTPDERTTTWAGSHDNHNSIAPTREASQDSVHIQAPSTAKIPDPPKTEEDSHSWPPSAVETHPENRNHFTDSPVDVAGDAFPGTSKGLKRDRSVDFENEGEYRRQRSRG